jgi:HSP20 family protein
MNLVHWNPFDEMHHLHRFVHRFPTRDDDTLQNWAPAVDIFERGDDLVLRAEVPDVRKEDLDVKVENNTLTLHGEKRRDESVQDENYHRTERHYGSFTRSFTLPSSVDTSRILASYKNGVLEVVLPKAEEAKPKQIEVKVA